MSLSQGLQKLMGLFQPGPCLYNLTDVLNPEVSVNRLVFEQVQRYIYILPGIACYCT